MSQLVKNEREKSSCSSLRKGIAKWIGLLLDLLCIYYYSPVTGRNERATFAKDFVKADLSIKNTTRENLYEVFGVVTTEIVDIHDWLLLTRIQLI